MATKVIVGTTRPVIDPYAKVNLAPNENRARIWANTRLGYFGVTIETRILEDGRLWFGFTPDQGNPMPLLLARIEEDRVERCD